MTRIKTRIGVCNLQTRVCPRFDLTPEILVFDTSSSEDECTEKIEVQGIPLEKIIDLLIQRGVSVVVSGGIQGKFQTMLQSKKIDVIWGVAGAVQDVVRAYREGVLHSDVRIGSQIGPRGTSVVSHPSERRADSSSSSIPPQSTKKAPTRTT